MKFSEEEKYQLVERYQNGESASAICFQTGISKSTFYTWLKPYKVSKSNAGYNVSANEFIKMKQHLLKLEQEIEVLQKANCTVSAPLKERLCEMALLHGQYSVRVLCEALDVDRGTFYNHIFRNKGENSSYQIRRSQLSEHIKKIFEESNQIYGAKKIRAVLAEKGIATSDRTVAELMREMNLISIRIGAKKNYIRLGGEKKEDSLKMSFSVKSPNQVWVSDVTRFKVNDKFQYICAIIDLYSRKVIAYKISQKHSTQLITSTFKSAYAERKPEDKLIFHSDRGTQYTSYSFQKLLKSLHVKQSFSPSGKPHHNAVMEAFFASMKKEELYRTNYHSVSEFKKRIEKYIEFYNTERPHVTLDYKSPNTHERLFFDKKRTI